MESDAIVIGGGISGLATAWWLQRNGVETVLLEQSDRTGGKIESESRAGYLMDHAASMVVNQRPEVQRFIREAGLSGLLVARNALAEEKRYLLHQGRLRAVPARIGRLLACPVWSARGKLRVALEPFIKRGGDEDETVADFVRRRLGAELLNTAVEPYVSSILASDAEQANAYCVLPRLTAMERRFGSIVRGMVHARLKRGSGMKSAVFSFRDGMKTLPRRLAETLLFSDHARCLQEHHVVAMEPRHDGWRVICQSPGGERRFRARHVVLAVPAEVSSRLLRSLDAEVSELLAGIAYSTMSVVHTGFERDAVAHPLDGNGFLTPRRGEFLISGNLWMSSIFPNRAPRGKVLLTSYIGGARKPRSIDWPDERLCDQVMWDLGKTLGIRSAPEMVCIRRHPRALPLYYGSYYKRCRSIRNRLQGLRGLSLEANYMGGVAIRDRLASSRAAATRIMGQLGMRAT